MATERGIDFKSRVGTILYKFLNDDLKHKGFKYEIGPNIDTNKFCPNANKPGGLYFCDETTLHVWWSGYGQKLAVIEIPDDAQIFTDYNGFKADKFVIRDIINFDDVSDDFWLYIFRKDVKVLSFIKNQTPELCKNAVRRNGLALKYVKQPTDEICCLAIQENEWAERYAEQYIDVKNKESSLCTLF